MRWLARSEAELPADLGWLTEYESARLAGMRFTKRRTEYLLRRWTGKHAVASVAGIDHDPASLARIDVRNRRTGAPHVQVDGHPLGMDLSLTDRAGWAVCLVAAQGFPDTGTVGVDLEVVEPRTSGFLADFLTPAERLYVTSRAVTSRADDDGRHAAANLVWSAKESALKVLGTGLRADTRSVEVTVMHDPRADGWSRLVVGTSGGRQLPGWWRREGEFLLTVAYAILAEPPQVLAESADLATAVPVHSWVARPTSR